MTRDGSCPCCGGQMKVVEETGERLLLRCGSCLMTDVKLKPAV